MNDSIKIINITKGTMADGPGIRNTIWAAGCAHHCLGCHNPQTWDFNSGYDVSVYKLAKEVGSDSFVDVTFSGGDPVYQAKKFAKLARILKQEYHKNIWLYTGFLLEDIYKQPGGSELLKWVDVVVDGPFVESLKEPKVPFRGSSNQKILYKGRDF